MAYSDFNLKTACRDFGLSLEESIDLHGLVSEVAPSPMLAAQLEENVPLATAIHTKKARSELIVMPILVETRRTSNHQVSLFSGLDFPVAPERGLSGICDFLLARSPVQLFLEAPVMALVEAKNDNIKSGLGQCVAEMVAAQIYNEREQKGPSTIEGAVTTGTLWRFLRLDGTTITIDEPEYSIERIAKILGILQDCVGGPYSESATPSPRLASLNDDSQEGLD